MLGYLLTSYQLKVEFSKIYFIPKLYQRYGCICCLQSRPLISLRHLLSCDFCFQKVTKKTCAPGSRCQRRFSALFCKKCAQTVYYNKIKLNRKKFRNLWSSGLGEGGGTGEQGSILSDSCFLKTQWFSARFLQSFSAHFSAFLCEVFALNFLKNQRISAHFLHKFSRPGPVKNAVSMYWNFVPLLERLSRAICFFNFFQILLVILNEYLTCLISELLNRIVEIGEPLLDKAVEDETWSTL